MMAACQTCRARRHVSLDDMTMMMSVSRGVASHLQSLGAGHAASVRFAVRTVTDDFNE